MKKSLSLFLPLAVLILLAGKCPAPHPPIPPPTVTIEVCTASGILPNEWCPAKELRVFPRGTEPTALCTIHAAPEPVAKAGPPWIGISCYQGIVFPLEAIKAHVDRSVGAGGNADEYFLTFTWPVDGATAGWRWQPYLQIGRWKEDADAQGSYFLAEWTEAGQAKSKREALTEGPPSFPGRWFPLFDLNQPNEEVWTKWAAIFAHHAKRGVAFFGRLYDFCSYKTAEDQRHSAFRSNRQRKIDGTLTGGLWGEPIKAYYAAFQARLVEELKKSGVTYFLVPMNEADYLADAGDTEETKDAKVVDFHRWVREDLLGRGIPADRLIASVSRAEAKVRALGYILELHGCNSPQRMDSIKAAYGAGVSFNGDGPDPYAEGVAGDKPGKRQPSTAQGTVMGAKAKAWGAWAVLFFAREVESADPPDLARIDEGYAVLRALAAAAGLQ